MRFKQRLSQSIIVVGLCLFIFNMSITSVTAAAKSENIEVHKFNFTFTVEGQHYVTPIDQQGFIYESRTYVPLRFASYMLEKWVDWDKTKKAVMVSEPTAIQLDELKQRKKEFLESDVAVLSTLTTEKKVLPVYSNYGSFIIYGKEQLIPNDVTTILHNGTIYVPLRYFGEVLAHHVQFNEQTKNITIQIAKQSSEQKPVDVEQIVTTPPNKNTDIVFPGGNSEISVTRESIVESAEIELNRLKAIYIAKVTELGQAYEATKDEEQRSALIAEGFSFLSEADINVSEVLANLDQTLITNGYEVGTDSKKFSSTYNSQKDALFETLLSKN